MNFSCDVKIHYPNFSLEACFSAGKGTLLSILGPSGCGKTTLLRAIAGLEKLREGSIHVEGKDITNLPPEKRNVGFVFQDYALFSHLNVYDNVAYGPKTQKWPKKRIEEAVRSNLNLVGLGGYGKRKIHELSGGEQQRTALARALAVEPAILLFDEPLSALDAGTRVELRRKISEIQKELGITTLYVTHDQQEAMAISDNIVLLREGRVIQSGTPSELYFTPKNEFSARFMGTANILQLDWKIIFRPEHCRTTAPPDQELYHFQGPLTYYEYLGKEYAAEMVDEKTKSVINFYLPGDSSPCINETYDIFVCRKDTKELLE